MAFNESFFTQLLTDAVQDRAGAVQALTDYCARCGFPDAAFVLDVVLARRAFPELGLESTEALKFQSYQAWVNEQQLLAALKGLPWPPATETARGS
jgi:hypothetical protein